MYDCMCVGKGLAVMCVYGPSVCGVLGVSQESHHLEGGELLGRHSPNTYLCAQLPSSVCFTPLGFWALGP